MKKILLFILFVTSDFTYSGGSFRLDTELMPVLDSNPELKQVVLNSFEFAESGGASRIGFMVNENLAGTRLGPYYFNAKPKDQDGNFTLTIIFHTEIEFFDGRGKEIDEVSNAVDIQEKFYSYEVLPLGKTSAYYLDNRF